MKLSHWHKIIIHSASLLIILSILVGADLNLFIFVIALCLTGTNIVFLIRLTINYDSSDTTSSYKSIHLNSDKSSSQISNVKQFEGKVRSAFQRNYNKNCGYIEEENKYWNSSYFNKSEGIEELRNIKLSDLHRQRTARLQEMDNSLKQQGMSTKKIRSYLEIREREDEITIKSIKNMVDIKFKEFKDFSGIVVSQSQIKQSLIMIQRYINNKISTEYDQIVNDFNLVNKFLQKCFSLSLIISNSSSQTTINYQQLMETVDLIQKKQIIPNRFSSRLTPLQIKRQLSAVRKNINNLPNLLLPNNIIKLSIYFKYLKEQFKGQTLVFSRLERDDKLSGDAKCHIFKCQQNNSVYYNKQASIKSRYASTPILIFLLCNLNKFYKQNRDIVKELRYTLNL